MKTLYLTILIILFIGGCIYTTKKTTRGISQSNRNIEAEQNKKNPWEVLSLKGQMIYFRNGKTLNTYLYDLKYIGQLPSKNKAPYVIISGRSCENCDENTSIYIHSPSDGAMKSHGKQVRYSYPGKEFDAETNTLVFESKMYFGDCFENYPNSIVWNQKFLNDQNEWEKSIFIVQIYNDIPREIDIRDISILSKLKKVTTCREVKGIERNGEM